MSAVTDISNYRKCGYNAPGGPAKMKTLKENSIMQGETCSLQMALPTHSF
jgi:hypothetical protein